jgi:hypothetical protein
MPFRIDKKDNKFLLYNLHKKTYVKKQFKTKQTAIKMGKQYIKFREKKSATVKEGRFILPVD